MRCVIRTNKFNRFRTIVSLRKKLGKIVNGSTLVQNENLPIYNFYPIYDWRTRDIGLLLRFDFKYNELYELFYKAGLSIHEARICQPMAMIKERGLVSLRQ